MIEFLDALADPDVPFLRYALMTGLLASVAFGIMGAYVVARRITYIAGAISHCVLGGIGAGLYLQTVVGLQWCQPMYGAVAAALLAALIIGTASIFAQEREDTVIGAVWAVGMAVGLLFLAKTPGYVDPMSYLFGDILLISAHDLYLVVALDALVVGLAACFHNKFLAVCFDEEFTELRGVRVRCYYLLLLCLIALTVVLLVRVVGIVMVIALLTLPAAVAGQLARRLWQMMALGVLFCMAFVSSGLCFSYTHDLPAGPTIIVIAGAVYLLVALATRLWRHKTVLPTIILLGTLTPCVTAGEPPKRAAVGDQIANLAGMFAPKLRRKAPDWVPVGEEPLFTFVWASDFHLDGSRLKFIAKALAHIDGELHPNFVMITGDNNAQPAPPVDPKRPEPLALRRQLFFKTYLAKHLKTPYVLIPGDNWPDAFDQVFGAAQFSFDYGGLHFLFTSPDRQCRRAKMEGLSVFDEPTWAWMRKDFERNRHKPVIVALHEPIVPPTFLDAKRLRQLLDRYPNVIACFQGHLHADLEFEAAGRKYFVCPALGPTSRPAMKLVSVFPRVVILRTVEYRKDAERFEIVAKWQKVDVPEPLRKSLARPPAGRFVMHNQNALPAHARRADRKLGDRSSELVGIVQEFVTTELPRMIWRRTTSW